MSYACLHLHHQINSFSKGSPCILNSPCIAGWFSFAAMVASNFQERKKVANRGSAYPSAKRSVGNGRLEVRFTAVGEDALRNSWSNGSPCFLRSPRPAGWSFSFASPTSTSCHEASTVSIRGSPWPPSSERRATGAGKLEVRSGGGRGGCLRRREERIAAVSFAAGRQLLLFVFLAVADRQILHRRHQEGVAVSVQFRHGMLLLLSIQ